jgi:Tfp pilus assembly protein FimT
MNKKNGFTLLEVTLGMIALTAAAVSMQMLMPKRESQSMQAVTESKKITTALRMARQIAVAKQTQVRLRFLGSARQATGFVVENLVGGSYSPVMQESITASASANAIVFSPTGAADSALRVNVGIGDQVRQIDVIAGSGMVRRDEP